MSGLADRAASAVEVDDAEVRPLLGAGWPGPLVAAVPVVAVVVVVLLGFVFATLTT
jgi:hypothetical protein